MARVLIIDDNDSVRQILRYVLTQAGHEPEAAKSGAEGLQLFRERPPALVLLDIHMPLMSGYEVCEAIKRERPDLPVLMITGCPTREVVGLGRAAGAHDVLKKPFELKELLATVGRLVDPAATAPAGPAAPTGT